MRKSIIIRILFFVFSIFGQNIFCSHHNDDLLAVVIMVKDEVDVIVPTLQPFIDAGVKSFLVFDTGSTDGTQDTIRDYFEKSGVLNAHIIEEPFIDFATSRNRALDLAEDIFSDHTFLLMLDAEWYIHDVEELLNFCEKNKNYIAPYCTGGCYLMRLFTIQDSINNYVPRLIRRGYNVRYTGVVHETIPDAASGIVTESVYFEYAPQQCGQEKSKARCARDYALLKKSYESDPANMRTLFYLGQTCQFLNEWEQAIFYYKKRFELGPLSEEKYLAAYRIGCAIEHILEEYKKNNIVEPYRWEDALYYYLKAHNMLPHRAEPLFRIACYYIRNNEHATAYLFAVRAAQLPYPHKNGLFVEKRIYDHLRYDILGQCALYAGECEIGKCAVLKAMEIMPDDACLHHNLAVYNTYSAT
jgi:glycosyltransferase involved in cell wall biosynthesis